VVNFGCQAQSFATIGLAFSSLLFLYFVDMFSISPGIRVSGEVSALLFDIYRFFTSWTSSVSLERLVSNADLPASIN
jgi:hypothetical protein